MSLLQRRLFHSQEMEDSKARGMIMGSGNGTAVGETTTPYLTSPQVNWYNYAVASLFVDEVQLREMLKPVRIKKGKIEIQQRLLNIIRKGAHFAGTVMYAADTWHEVVCGTLRASPRESNSELVNQLHKCERAIKACAENGELRPSTTLLIETGLYQYLLRAEHIQATGGKRHYSTLITLMLVPCDEQVAKMWEKTPKLNRAIGMEFRLSKGFKDINERLKNWTLYNDCPKYECIKIKQESPERREPEEVINVAQKEANEVQEHGQEAWEAIWPKKAEQEDGKLMPPPKDATLKRKLLPRGAQPIKWRALNDHEAESEGTDADSFSQENESIYDSTSSDGGSEREVEMAGERLRAVAEAVENTLTTRLENAPAEDKRGPEVPRYPWEGIIDKQHFAQVRKWVEMFGGFDPDAQHNISSFAQLAVPICTELGAKQDQPEYPTWIVCLLVHAYLAKKTRASKGKIKNGLQELDQDDKVRKALAKYAGESDLLKSEKGLYELTYKFLSESAAKPLETEV